MASQFYILCKLFGVSIEGMFAARGGCENPGGAAILHTWSQNLLFHPHIHCVVPSGGLAPGRTRWIRGSATFFLPWKCSSKYSAENSSTDCSRPLMKNV